MSQDAFGSLKIGITLHQLTFAAFPMLAVTLPENQFNTLPRVYLSTGLDLVILRLPSMPRTVHFNTVILTAGLLDSTAPLLDYFENNLSS